MVCLHYKLIGFSNTIPEHFLIFAIDPPTPLLQQSQSLAIGAVDFPRENDGTGQIAMVGLVVCTQRIPLWVEVTPYKLLENQTRGWTRAV